MANYREEDYAAMCRAVVGAAQLGADIIKVRLPGLPIDNAAQGSLSRILRSSPPTVVAGGDASSKLGEILDLAKRLGMSGSCIGRHYFDHDEREGAVAQALTAFPQLPVGAFQRPESF
jgi:DhnA family fructose-bisphosphate aldolase class Ia